MNHGLQAEDHGVAAEGSGRNLQTNFRKDFNDYETRG